MNNMILNSDIFINRENIEVEKLEVEYNRLEFEVEGGFNQLNMVEELLALVNNNDIEFMYDIMMQLLVNKTLSIYLRDDNGNRLLQTSVHVTSRNMDLKGDDFIEAYPFVIECFIRFIAVFISKKYPPLSKLTSQEVGENKGHSSTGMKKTKKGSTQNR